MPHLLIGGMGTSPTLHLTPQLVARVADCSAIFVAAVTQAQLVAAASAYPGFADAVRDRSRTFFLHQIYSPDVDPRDNYARAVALIAERVAHEATVAFLTPGHPLYWDSVSRGLIERLGSQCVEVLPGVSSFDTFVADTHAEIEPYFVVLDASFAVARGIALDRGASYLFVQPHRVRHETVMNTDDELRDSCLVFQRYLAARLPLTARVVVGRSASIWKAQATIEVTDVAHLHEVTTSVWLGCSVLIERLV